MDKIMLYISFVISNFNHVRKITRFIVFFIDIYSGGCCAIVKTPFIFNDFWLISICISFHCTFPSFLNPKKNETIHYHIISVDGFIGCIF